MSQTKPKNILWKIHNWTGLYVGIVIAVLSLTGALAVFIPEIDHLLEARYHQIDKGENYTDVAVMLSNLQSQYPGFVLLNIVPPQKPDRALVFDFYNPNGILGSSRYRIFADPYTGEILAVKDHLNSLVNFLRQVHVRLLDGWYGRQLVGLAGLGLALTCITGLLIYGKFMKKQLFGTIRQGRGIRILMADWHKLIGMAALLFNLGIALTGAWLGLQPKLMSWLDIKIPNNYKRAEIPISADEDKGASFDYYGFLEKSRASIPGFHPVMVIPSVDGSQSVEIRGDLAGLPIEPHINKVVLDKKSGAVLFAYDIRDQEWGHWLYFLQEGLHFGRFGGLGLKIAYALLALTSGFLSISGFVIYLSRKKGKQVQSSMALKKTIVFTLYGIGVLIILGFGSVWVGYVYMSVLVTPLVYLTLVGILVYSGIKMVKKRMKKHSIYKTKV
ncbi:PepSY-associated TM helix domain-containing protein [Belliella marina]|uniref:PepSY-associated TM helix domain-containing protein n=1 Tax=Belliella marina TaxID=1644146 RepID=A0ABW4VKX3_9BACT